MTVAYNNFFSEEKIVQHFFETTQKTLALAESEWAEENTSNNVRKNLVQKRS